VALSGFRFPDEDIEEKQRLKKIIRLFKPFTDWWREQLTDKVADVVVSLKLLNDPCVLVGRSQHMSANMENIQKA